MKISIGSDHAGFLLKKKILFFLNKAGNEVIDLGCNSEDSVDYPDFAHKVAESVKNKETDFGVIMCGSGNGINMAANKHKGIRSALCWNTEIAKFARQHNNANILALPARFINEEEAEKIVKIFFNTSFEGGRHQRRIEKIDKK